MWVRKRIDVSWRDLIWAIFRCLIPPIRVRRCELDEWSLQQNLLIALSIRSGFDLIWRTLKLDPGAEIILSGFTIPDMPKIVGENGLRPVIVDIELDTMGPNLEALKRQITPRTRAIVVAHLWGGLVDLAEIAEIADQHDLLLIEDCAQSYAGNGEWGDSRADISMFSFGSIKTNSALGGAVFRVQNDDLFRRLDVKQQELPIQSRFAYFRRLIKYMFVKAISARFVAWIICRAFGLFGANHDRFAANLAKGFAGKKYFKRIRQKPCLPLRQLMSRKLAGYDVSQILTRQRLGEHLKERLRICFAKRELALQQEFDPTQAPQVVGECMLRQTFWLFALLVEHPEPLIQQLWEAGFDATSQASLCAIGTEKSGRNSKSTCRWIEDHIVYLPFDVAMPVSEIERMARVVCASNARCPRRCASSNFLATKRSVSPTLK